MAMGQMAMMTPVMVPPHFLSRPLTGRLWLGTV
jgi:hypothetical protein